MISFLYHKRELHGDISHILFGITINEKTHDLFVKFPSDSATHKENTTIDFILPILTILGSKLHLPIDLGGHKISHDALGYCDKIIEFYTTGAHTNTYSSITISNYSLQEKAAQGNKEDNVGLFFSGGVDSYYSFYENQDRISDLLCIWGFDIRHTDTELRDQAYEKFASFGAANSKRTIAIETNIREMTEEYIHRDMIYGASLGTIAGAIYQDLHIATFIISSRITHFDHHEGSDPNLDSYFGMGNFTIEHFGAGISRPQKITALSQHHGREDALRVCRENRSGKYNCGVCEKCTRTLLTLHALGLQDNIKSFENTELGERNFEGIELSIRNKAYYEDILAHFERNSVPTESDLYLIGKVKNLLTSNDSNTAKKSRVKHKNILFIDFNGVISYKPFWHSRRDENNSDYEVIQKILFGENIELVRERMIGRKTSEEICLFLADHCSTSYEGILNVLIQDCKTIDISPAIMERLNRLKPHYQVILVTDNMDCFNRWTLPNNPIIEGTFDHIRDSYTHQHPKKEHNGKIFLSFVKEKNAKIDNCILIDDSKNNCRVFDQIGGQAFPLNNEQDVIDKLTQLFTATQNKRLRQY